MAVTDDLRDATAEQAKTLAELRRLVGEDPFLYVVLERLAEGQRDLEEVAVGGAAAARIMLLEAKVARLAPRVEALAAENVDLVSEIEHRAGLRRDPWSRGRCTCGPSERTSSCGAAPVRTDKLRKARERTGAAGPSSLVLAVRGSTRFTGRSPGPRCPRWFRRARGSSDSGSVLRGLRFLPAGSSFPRHCEPRSAPPPVGRRGETSPPLPSLSLSQRERV